MKLYVRKNNDLLELGTIDLSYKMTISAREIYNCLTKAEFCLLLASTAHRVGGSESIKVIEQVIFEEFGYPNHSAITGCKNRSIDRLCELLPYPHKNTDEALYARHGIGRRE